MYKHFIGIDVSKLTIDVSIYGSVAHHKFNNNTAGYQECMDWLNKMLQTPCKEQMLVCFEHTGLYSLTLSDFLQEARYPFVMISPLEIKRSMGITRGKNDKIDARRIAEYAYEKREKIVPTVLPSKPILQLHPLLTLRDRMARAKAAYEATLKEQKRCLSQEEFPDLFDAYKEVIACLAAKIKQLEKAIREIIANNDDIRRTFELITAIKGVGFLVGSYLIVYTHNFTKFENWRKFACYAGIAPFEKVSGTSVKGKPQVSHLANKQMKKMLHLAALRAAYTEPDLIEYYNKRIGEGKSKMCALNIVRNKVLARVFAVATRGTEYIRHSPSAA